MKKNNYFSRSTGILGLIFSAVSTLTFAQQTLVNTGGFSVFPGAKIAVFGDFKNNGTFESTGGEVHFAGTTLQTISGTGAVNIHDVIVNNAAHIKLDNQLAVGNTLTFTNGKINSDRVDHATQYVHFLAGSSYSGADNTKFIDGVARKTGNTAFVFPVGADADMQPLSIGAPSLITKSYTTYYERIDTTNFVYDPYSLEPGINNVSTCENWILDAASGMLDVTFSLNYDANSCGITVPSELIVARWDGAQWTSLGTGTLTGNASAGTIAQGIACSGCGAMLPVTLGSTSGNNPLPIELLNFTAVNNNRTIDLNWQTATEHNNDYYTVERSKDGINFEILTTVPAVGNSVELLSYTTKDNHPYSGLSYYRLKQVDTDGSFEYADIRSVVVDGISGVQFFPNPSASNIMQLVSQTSIDQLEVFESSGKLVVSKSDIGFNYTLKLNPGVYYATYTVDGKLETTKLIFID